MDMYKYGDVVVNNTDNVTLFIVQKSNFFSGSIMVLGSISCDVRTDLHFFDSTLMYIDVLNYIVPSLHAKCGCQLLIYTKRYTSIRGTMTLKFLEEIKIARFEK